jgi:pimeloyl-ACP methyl ester carboxylesterase
LRIELNYKVIGEGFPIIILHGLFGMLDNWQTIGKKIADAGYMVYLIDQRDHGKSPFTTEFNYKILAEDLYQFMEENWLYKAHLIGHSMGGKAVMQFAFDHEEMIEKLVVVDVCNKKYKGGHELIFKAIKEIDVHITENRDIIYQHLKSYDLDEGTVQFLLKNLQRKKERGYEWKMNVDLLEQNYEYILGSVGQSDQICNVDTLFIRGGESNYIKKDDYTNIKLQFPSSYIDTIEEAGHWVHADKPTELLNLVLNFLN